MVQHDEKRLVGRWRDAAIGPGMDDGANGTTGYEKRNASGFGELSGVPFESDELPGATGDGLVDWKRPGPVKT